MPESRIPKQSPLEKFTRILGMVMSFVYVVLGVGLYTKALDFPIEDIYRKILGAGLVIYGAYRFYRAMKGNVGNNLPNQ
jgi:hypothetical protein